MGPHFSKINEKVIHLTDQQDGDLNINAITSDIDPDDILLSLYLKNSLRARDLNDEDEDLSIINSEKRYLKQLQSLIEKLTHSQAWNDINLEIHEILVEHVSRTLIDYFGEAIKEIESIVELQNKLRESFTNNTTYSSDVEQSIFSCQLKPKVSNGTDEQSDIVKDQKRRTETRIQQVSHFAIQSLSSILVLLIESATKNDPTLVHRILTLARQLCEQMPLKSLSSSLFPMPSHQFLLRALEPLSNYFDELSRVNDPIIAKQALQILLSFALVKGSFREILIIINKLMFNTVDMYPMQGLLRQLNHGVEDVLIETTMIKQYAGLDFLKSLEFYPNCPSRSVKAGELSGQLIASILLAHIDFHNEISSVEHFESGSMNSSFSFDFHPETFKLLFLMTEKLRTQNDKTPTTSFMLTACVRLFVTHLKYFSTVKSSLNKDLFSTNDSWGKSSPWNRFQPMNDIDFSQFATETEAQQWFKIFSDIVFNNDDPSETSTLKREASKGLIYLLNITTLSFTDKLSFINEHLLKNENPSFVESAWFELNRKVTLLSWMEALCSEQSTSLAILKSLIDKYATSPRDQLKLKELLLSLQKLLLSRFILQASHFQNVPFLQFQHETAPATPNGLSLLMVEYIRRILSEHSQNKEAFDDFLHPILLTLCYIVNTFEKINFSIVWPIIAAVLPSVADALLQTGNLDSNLHSLSWLLGRMSQFLIIGSMRNPLEDQYADQLNSILFADGFEQNIELKHLFESNLAIQSKVTFDEYRGDSLSENEFLMSIYTNTGHGAQLIDRMRFYVKQKYIALQKSIESFANEACPALFAVYIKHYQCIELAKSELSLAQDVLPHNKLLTLYEYANQVYTVFAKVKGQGGDCQELNNQIKANTLVLLSNIKANKLISSAHENTTSDMAKMAVSPPAKGARLMRQNSRWTKAKHVFKMLRSTLRVCVQLKKIIKSKKSISAKPDYEKLLRQCIDNFVYGNISKALTSTSNTEKSSITEDICRCLSQQYERAMMRLITYRFSELFLRKLLSTQNNRQIRSIVSVYLPHLRHVHLQWSHQNNIETVSTSLKQQITNHYYACIKLVVDYLLQSDHEGQTSLAIPAFNLLNMNYQLTDLDHLHRYQFVETIFTSMISSIKQSDKPMNMKLAFIAFNWFRMFVLRLCENIQVEHNNGAKDLSLQEQGQFIFNRLILDELKYFREKSQELIEEDDDDNSDVSKTEPNDSLNQVAFRWFLDKDLDELSPKSGIELKLNQWIVLVLRCIHFYPHVQTICTTIEYIEELLSIYRQSQRLSSRLLALKVLRYLISFSSETTNGVTNAWIRTILMEIFDSIKATKLNPSLTSERIDFYRTIMSVKSAWQTMATQIVVNGMTLNVEKLNALDTTQMNDLMASLCILGGYIQPFSLGSIVNAYVEQDNIHDHSLAIITEDKNDEGSYFVQYVKSIEPEWTAVENLRSEIDVPPPNLFSLPQAHEMVHTILDKLGSCIQIDTMETESLSLLQLKRYCICALSHLLNDRKLIGVFMQKPYASVVTDLAIRSLSSKHRSSLAGLREFQKDHLEQYYLSLDSCKLSEITHDETENTCDKENTTADENNDPFFSVWNKTPMTPNSEIIDVLSASVLKYNGWKANASEAEIEFLKQGRTGQDEIVIVPMPVNVVDARAIEECGDTHRFRGRIDTSKDGKSNGFPSFKIHNLSVAKGKWYFCVKLPQAGLVQIGWATDGFSPFCGIGIGVGDDSNSWSYDGSRRLLFNGGNSMKYPDDETCWSVNDICGCGISIDDDGTKIGYWLNGKFLGTAFAERSYLGPSVIKCNMKPNGANTSYYPSVSLQSLSYDTNCCELIVSPEDMTDCPLPDGYKPLLLPKLVNTENSIVRYPCNAYLIGDTVENYFQTSRQNKSTTRLRDFINECHLETSFSTDDKYLLLSETSNGLPFPIDNLSSPLTISFDFKLLGLEDEHDKKNIRLFTLGDFSAEIPKLNEEVRIAIVLYPKEQQMKVYMNEKCRLFYEPMTLDNTVKLTMNILPNINAGIRNLAIWRHALVDEDISRLFTYGLFYVGVDYRHKTEYRRRVNMFTFTENQQAFVDEFLIPFKEPFEEDLWNRRKQEVDHDESTYFKSITGTGHSVLQFFGSKTYVALDISSTKHSELTLILDIYIPMNPNPDEQITLVTFSPQSSIYITHNGRICLSSNNELVKIGAIDFVINSYVRLVISITSDYCRIYTNGSLTLFEEKPVTIVNPILLFRENDSTKITTDEHRLRIECKLIGFLPQLVHINHRMTSTNVSLDSLFALPISLMIPSLSAMGYKMRWITSVLKSSTSMNIQAIETLLHERKQELIESDVKSQRESYVNMLSTLSPSIDQDKFENFITSSKLENANDLLTTTGLILAHWNDLRESQNSVDENKSIDKKWLLQTMYDPSNPDSLSEWLSQKINSNDDEDPIDRLFDLDQNSLEESDLMTTVQNSKKKMKNSIEYSHQEMSSKHCRSARIACEHGLMSIYARKIVFNLLNMWSNSGESLFPLESLTDFQSLIILLRFMHFQYSSTSDQINANIDNVSMIAKSIIRTELVALQNQINTDCEITGEVLQRQAPFLSELQKDLVGQAVLFVADPSLLSKNPYENIIHIDEQTLTKRPHLGFLLKMISIQAELISDKSILSQDGIDLIIPFVFPELLINLLFDLFLLNPIYQTEVAILRIFTTLTQASQTFELNESMLDFFINLLNQVSNNDLSTKKFKIAVFDLIYVMSIRVRNKGLDNNTEDNKLTSALATASENIKDLLILIDVVDVLIDRNKQKSSPESYFTRAASLLDEKYSFTREDFELAHHHFNAIADQELMRFMNNNTLLQSSFDEYISSLPTESEPNPTFYKDYTMLSTIPACAIKTRSIGICILNTLFENGRSIVDLSYPSGHSIVADRLRNIKNYLSYRKKFASFEESIQRTSTGSVDRIAIELDAMRAALPDENGENTMFYQVYQRLRSEAQQLFRSDEEHLWHVTYRGLSAIDAGGPFRDSITRICADICSTHLPLFILCPNGRMNAGLNRDRWIPNVFSPNESIPRTFRDQYKFIGQLMGMAIRKKYYLDLKFPTLLWKQLANESVTVEDIEAIDLQSFKVIEEVERNFSQNEFIDDEIDMGYLFSSVMSELRFSVVSSAGPIYELIPDGNEIPITIANFKEYCRKYRDYRLDEFRRQIEFIAQGLYSVVPFYYLSLFTANELEEAVCGKGCIDVELLKRNTIYNHPNNVETPHIQRFWTVLSEMFNEAQKKSFIAFVWGRSTLPRCDEDFTTKFTINSYYASSDNVDGLLPKSHTCSFSLDLPEYSTTKIMYERLNYAITYCSSIDGD